MFYYAGCLPSVFVVGNMDFQCAAPQVQQVIETLHQSKQRLNHLWGSRKTKMEQCLQLRIFEADVEKVS